MTDITLEALKLRERELELDAVLIRGRVLEIRNMIQEMERRRGGRPRKGEGVLRPRSIEALHEIDARKRAAEIMNDVCADADH